MSGKSGMRNSGGGIAVRGGAAARSAAGTTQHVRLGDVAEEVRENWSGPTADVPVVGLEHIEPDEIWLRKWEVNPDENTFSKAFRKGQLLFGRRRAYQKKLSLAPSDGICSGDITVIAAKSDKVVPSLLPFLLRTDKFFDYAIQGSAGSLSPRVKWAHLAKYEFDLPPMDEQKKLAELLWAANDLKESYKKAITATDEMLKAKFREMFGDAGDDSSRGGAETRSKWPMVPLGSCADVLAGYPFKSENFSSSGIPLCGGLIIMPDRIKWEESKYWPSSNGLEKFLLCKGDVVLALDRPWISEGFKIGLIKENDLPCLLIQRTARIRSEKFDPLFLLGIFQGTAFAEHCSTAGSVVPHISHKDIESFLIPLPPLSLQREFVAIADKAESAKANLKKSIAAIDQVMKGLING